MKRKLSKRHNKRKTTKRIVNKQKEHVKYSKILGGATAEGWAISADSRKQLYYASSKIY